MQKEHVYRLTNNINLCSVAKCRHCLCWSLNQVSLAHKFNTLSININVYSLNIIIISSKNIIHLTEILLLSLERDVRRQLLRSVVFFEAMFSRRPLSPARVPINRYWLYQSLQDLSPLENKPNIPHRSSKR